MGIQLIVNGTDLSNYVVSTERTHSICSPIATMQVQLAANLPFDILPYYPVILYEEGTKVFTGYVDEFVKARMSMSCSDVLVKARDTWITDKHTSIGESVAHWVSFFLNISGLNDQNISAGGDWAVQEYYSWQFTTALNAITTTIQMSPLQVYADRDGTVHLVELRRGSPEKTINEFVSFERTRNDSWIRNRVVVFGNTPLVVGEYRPNAVIPDEVRTATIATGMIYDYNQARNLAIAMLDEFEDPLDVKVVEIPGDPDIELGQTYRLVESWSGYSDTCIVTSNTTRYNKHEYISEITFDEKCPHFWGWGRPPREYLVLYAGTWGLGVYKSYNSGESWDNTTLGSKHVYDIHCVDEDVVWAACREGLYLTVNGGDDWWLQTTGPPVYDGEDVINSDDMYFVGVVTENYNTSKVYALAGDFGNHGMWIYYSVNNGLDWNNVRTN